MGTPSNTRISNESDYIDHYTRWDGFHSEIHDVMNSAVSDWEVALSNLKDKLSNEQYGTVSINEWIEIFEKNLAVYKQQPTIDFTSFLHCIRSFSHHHVLPTHFNNKTDLSSNLTNDIDFTAHLANQTFAYSYESISIEHPIIEVKRKDIDPEYKVLRIYEIDENGLVNNNEWTDFKYKNLDEQQIFSNILKLPLFLRDIYTLTKMSATEQASCHYNLDVITRLMTKLSQFYQPTSEYSRFTRDRKNDVRSVKERKKSVDVTIDDAVHMLPFDLYPGSLGTQIMLANAGNILPLTKAESLSDYDISFKVGLYGDRMSHIFCYIPNNKDDETLDWLNGLAAEYNNQIHYFDNYHTVNTITDSVQFVKLIANTEEFVGLAYQKTIIDLMENQYSIEVNLLLEENDS
jgi:hypothetical protein